MSPTPPIEAAPGEASPGLSVVIPAYNEADRIRGNLAVVGEALSGTVFELIVVDDGSTDDTYREALRARSDGLPVTVVRQGTNQGKGAALAAGFAATVAPLVAFLDADLEISPAHLPALREALERTGADGVVAVRSSEIGVPAFRLAMSAMYRHLVVALFDLPLSETQAGAKLFRRDVLDACVPRLAARRFAFDVELLVACQRFGFTVIEAPVQREFARPAGGRIRATDALGLFLETLGVYRRASFVEWLRPGPRIGLWFAALAAGLVLVGIGIGKLVTPLVLRPPLSDLFYYLALQFLPRGPRDWLLLVVGAALAAVAYVELNKGLLAAFSGRDRGDLAGIWRRRGRGP